MVRRSPATESHSNAVPMALDPYTDSADYSGLVGRAIAGGLRVTARAGSTPQGLLYQAEYLDGRQVLLLVLPSRVPGQEPPGVQSFRLATRIRHPNVAAVRAVGELDDGSAYVVLEQLTGEPLRELLTAGSALPLGEALNLALQAAAGLEAVHQAGFVHGNVSPGTLVVSRAPYGNAQVKVVGFSLDPDGLPTIRLEPASVEYASPERLGGKPPDPRCDVFSLGAVLHHLLGGGAPAAGRVAREVPRIARPVLEQALAPAPAARFQTMSELRDALERLAAAAASPRQPVARRAARAVAAGLVLLACGLLLVPLWRTVETRLSPTASRPARTEQASLTPRSPPRAATTPAPTRASAPTRSTEAGRVATEPRARTPGGGSTAVQGTRDRGKEESIEVSEPLGYVGDATSSEAPAEPAGRAPPPEQRPGATRPNPPKVDPPRPRAVLEEYPGLHHAIGDVTRIGLAENVAEVRPGLLAVYLAAGGMGVPSAEYNLQRLYLAYSAATRQRETVALELRRNDQVYGWFTREGLRYANANADRH